MPRAAEQHRDDATEARKRDAECVAQTLAGDLSGFDRLVEAHQRRAAAVAYRLLGNMNDALDVCQEAYIRAFRSLETLTEHEKFGSWLMRIVSNLALNYRRDRRPMLSLSMGDDSGAGADYLLADRAERGADLPNDSMLSAETHQAVTEAIERLPQKQRLALILFAIEGLPQKEVAEILECSIEAVKWNVFQARKTLKETLSEYMQ